MPNLKAFFNPESIALIGASRTPGKIGYSILENLKGSFQGKIYPISPAANEILDLKCYSSVLDIKEPIELAIIAVKAEIVKSVLEECIKKKIKGVIVISSGFSEISEKERELELKKFRKAIRIIGPNCIGIFTPKGLDMLFLSKEKFKRPKEGNISFISQSGAVGSAIMDLISYEGIGISKFISYGNALDVDEVELLEYLGKDVETRAIAMYLESTKRGLDLIKAVKKVKKPVVCLKAGKTQKGTQAVLSHTGALAGTAEVYSSAFKQGGIIEAQNTEELFDFAKVLASQPVLKNNKITIITDGGGFGILSTDSAIRCGLELPSLKKESIADLKKILPSYAITENPIDLTGDATAERYQKALEIAFKDPNNSGVVCIALLQIPTLEDSIIDVLRECKIYGKPFVVCMCGGAYTLERARKLESFGIPVYPTPERAVKAMNVLYQYGQILKKTKL